jgi:hypothetical protein
MGDTKIHSGSLPHPVFLPLPLARLAQPNCTNAQLRLLHIMDATCKTATQTSNLIGGSVAVGRSPLSTMNLYGFLACFLAPELP